MHSLFMSCCERVGRKKGLKYSITFHVNLCRVNLCEAPQLHTSRLHHKPSLSRVKCSVQHCPPVSAARHRSGSNNTPVILIPSNVSLSKTVTQSLPRSLPLSIRQSAVSHSLIQSVPRPLSLSVSRSFTHSIPLSLFAHLTSPSLTHLHSPPPPPVSSPIHHTARLSRQVFNCRPLTFGRPFSLYQGNLLSSKKLLVFSVFCRTSLALLAPQPSSAFYSA